MVGTFAHVAKNDGLVGLYSGVRIAILGVERDFLGQSGVAETI